jgi:hypothetical protein
LSNSDPPPAPETVDGEIGILRRQLLFREVNEQIEHLAKRADGDGTVDLLCECGDGGCSAQLSIPVRAYDSLRSHPTRFLVKAGHERPDADDVVERRDGYAVVEKTGSNARRAAELDPRRRH